MYAKKQFGVPPQTYAIQVSGDGVQEFDAHYNVRTTALTSTLTHSVSLVTYQMEAECYLFPSEVSLF